MSNPNETVIRRLREGKEHLREQRRAMTLPEKVRQVVELQKAVLPMIRQRRELHDWEDVWPLPKK
jgi:hypothetical protein